MIAVAYITAPRPKRTLKASINSLRDAGCHGLIRVFAEPGSYVDVDLTGRFVELNPNHKRMGNFRNWVQALNVTLSATAEIDAEYILICEDDITWARNAWTVLEREVEAQRWQGVGCMSLYTPNRMAQMIGRGSYPLDGWYGLRVGAKMWGAQALLFPRQNAIDLLDRCNYFRSQIVNPKIDKNIDLHVAESLLRRELAILYRIPCMVDHKMGDLNSSIYGNKDRPGLRTNYFRGVV